MATFLYRLGRSSFRRRRLVGAIWLLILLAAGSGAGMLAGPTTESFSIPGTESQAAYDLLDERFPGGGADGATARVVFAAPDGETVTDRDNAAAITEVLHQIAAGPQVREKVGPDAMALS